MAPVTRLRVGLGQVKPTSASTSNPPHPLSNHRGDPSRAWARLKGGSYMAGQKRSPSVPLSGPSGAPGRSFRNRL
eukprot:83548-Pyramimonas_sp.AAC.1